MQVTDYDSPILTTATSLNAGCVILKYFLIQIIIYLQIFAFWEGIKVSSHENLFLPEVKKKKI